MTVFFKKWYLMLAVFMAVFFVRNLMLPKGRLSYMTVQSGDAKHPRIVRGDAFSVLSICSMKEGKLKELLQAEFHLFHDVVSGETN